MEWKEEFNGNVLILLISIPSCFITPLTNRKYFSTLTTPSPDGWISKIGARYIKTIFKLPFVMQGLLPLLIQETDLEIAQAVLALNNDNKISDFQFHSPYAAYIYLLVTQPVSYRFWPYTGKPHGKVGSVTEHCHAQPYVNVTQTIRNVTQTWK